MPSAHYSALGRGEGEKEEKVVCPVCLGDYRRCRLELCPYLKDVRETLSRIAGKRTIYGPSPPSALVGSWGYPRVNVGPLVTSMPDDAGLVERQEEWLDIPLEKILSMRLSLVHGRRALPVREAVNPGRILQSVQEVAIASRPVNLEMVLEKEPRLVPGFLVRAAPTGPAGPVEKIIVAENPSTTRIVERVVSDNDLRAEEAVFRLYLAGVPDYTVVRILSVGLLGTTDKRRIVPTEWSITAVDDIIGRRLRKIVRASRWIGEYRIYDCEAHFNRVVIFMMPGPWGFEVFETWWRGGQTRTYTDSELPGDVDRYSENVGGAYYAIRLPVLEKLHEEGRQATVLSIAEIREGWIPLGVWRFREISRRALSRRPRKFQTFTEALEELRRIVQTPQDLWITRSRAIRLHLSQEVLGEDLQGIRASK